MWRFWNNLWGVTTEVKFGDRSPVTGRRQLIVRETIPPERLNAVFDMNERQYNDTRIAEAVRGGTQRHKVQVANMPIEVYYQWRRELGNPHVDYVAARRWLARLNDSDHRLWRTAEGVL